MCIQISLYLLSILPSSLFYPPCFPLTLPASLFHSSLPTPHPSLSLQVIEWSTHHKDDPPPPEDDDNKEKRTDDIEPWDQEFLKVDQGTLFELILVRKVLLCFRGFILSWQ